MKPCVGRGYMGHDIGMAFAEQGDHLHQLRVTRRCIASNTVAHTAAAAPPGTAPSNASPGRRAAAADRKRSRPVHPTSRRDARRCGPWRRRSTKMLDELVGDLFVHRVVFGQNEGDLQHVLAVKRHPGGAVRLLQRTAGGQLAHCGRIRQCCPDREIRRRKRCVPAGPCG